MLNQAAIGNQPAVVQLLMGAGQPATHEDVLRAAQHASAQALPLLLSAGPQPAPASDPIERLELFWRLGFHYTCPILAALETRARTERDSSVEPLDASLLSVLEQLLAAGYRPAVFHDVEVHTHRQLAPVRRAVFEPLSDDPRLDVAGTNRWLALAIEHPAWSPAQHARFLPSFRAATRTLLLVLHRTSRTGSGSSSLASLLASLPNDPLLHIIGLAAYPLSTWAALDACDG
ncbi:coproporphyrinogen III oxidase [Chlorella sorokiniana]|uniref:Coproporphyrinogen III oxidase n=1 Tax=Chlorella sorokiniana TaxID=3076 RepID=A0A2P6TVU6_CHLSO|nr:coproporphyrinogen III oxidase [Chlorella sorokiniana]|eukprot:PRW58189.1 coproporphyrinogen III oxidase [Chlorella sorokiniana]